MTYGWGDLDGSTIDMFCVGEGEHAIVSFINDGISGKNILFRGQKPSGGYYPLVELDNLPLPDRSVIYERDSLSEAPHSTCSMVLRCRADHPVPGIIGARNVKKCICRFFEGGSRHRMV